MIRVSTDMVPPCSASKTIPHVKRPKSATLTTSDREKDTPGSGKAVEEFCPWHPTSLNFNFVNWCQKDADKCAPDGKIRECVNEVCVACGICSGYVCPPKRQLGSHWKPAVWTGNSWKLKGRLLAVPHNLIVPLDRIVFLRTGTNKLKFSMEDSCRRCSS